MRPKLSVRNKKLRQAKVWHWLALVVSFTGLFVISFFLSLPGEEYSEVLQQLLARVENHSMADEIKTESTKCHVEFFDPSMTLCHIVPWGANFGDELGPAVVQQILQRKYPQCSIQVPVLDLGKQEGFNHENKICLFTVGTVFFLTRDHDHIWGTGNGGAREWGFCRKHKNMTYYSVRGPQTAKALVQLCDVTQLNRPLMGSSLVPPQYGMETAGDPGFLIPFLFPEYKYDASNTTLDYCIIPHYFDRRNKDLKTIPKQQILTVQQSWQSMVQKMLQCRLVISTSLHGVILAEAFGIPVQWLVQARRVGTFKFEDYYSSFENPQRSWNASMSVADALQSTTPTVLPLKVRQAYADRIMKTFPYHLFRVVQDRTRASV